MHSIGQRSEELKEKTPGKTLLYKWVLGLLPAEVSDLKRGLKSNPNLTKLITELKILSRENEASIWREIAKRLEKPSRVWPEVNVATIDKHAKANENIVIAGKLLGQGTLTKPVTIAAYSASTSAKSKVENSGGKCIDILELAKSNPKGSGVRIMG